MISKDEIILKNNALNKSKRTTAPGIEAKNEKGKILFSALKIWISKIPFGEGKEIVPYPKTSLIKKNTSAKTQKKLHFTKTFFSSKRTDKLEEEYKFPRMKDVKAGIKKAIPKTNAIKGEKIITSWRTSMQRETSIIVTITLLSSALKNLTANFLKRIPHTDIR